ncbi:MAG: GntR family transcriptional regulator [Nitrosomonadales bacterium]|jgi:GntR family transcriptional regulator|nr:GntR family transcriptional regulator [Nitrosomonadales bacterium]MBT3918623.1 GntR family transcriptional regulator [Nitrosomonadales bacterium]MBT4183423.1 GntR family transcriptional regulator [Nitrosomonadales bacterium]MBT4571033.1 GntR family transcriptional regulator [Nitrosomonadales bacterium]MBT4759923.1 GntR family transcriptional regulator [Nitrosomonadales bacterium]
MQPLYEKVKKKITESLVQGEWSPGEAIPSETELANVYDVSQGTVRKAIDELSAESILIRRQGKGTYVATHNEENIQLRFLRLTSNFGLKEKLDNQLVSFSKEKATNKLAKILNINPASTIISLKRVLTFNEKPLILDLIKIPAQSFRGVTAEMVVEKKGSMYRMYESDFGVRMLRADEKIRAINANFESASLLNVKENTSLLSVERISYTYENKPLEWRLGLCVTDDHYYRSELD